MAQCNQTTGQLIVTDVVEQMLPYSAHCCWIRQTHIKRLPPTPRGSRVAPGPHSSAKSRTHPQLIGIDRRRVLIWQFASTSQCLSCLSCPIAVVLPTVLYLSHPVSLKWIQTSTTYRQCKRPDRYKRVGQARFTSTIHTWANWVSDSCGRTALTSGAIH